MYEWSVAECQRRRIILKEIRKEMEENHGPDLECDCHQSALAALPDLLVRLSSGDELAVEPILEFYKPCIDGWAKDAYSDPVYESQFKAEIAVRFIQTACNLESKSLCYELKLASMDVIVGHLDYIEEHQQQIEQAAPVLAESLN